MMIIDVLINITLIISVIYLFNRFIYQYRRTFITNDATRLVLITIIGVMLSYLTININSYEFSMFFVPLMLIPLIKRPMHFIISYGIILIFQTIIHGFNWQMILIFLIAYTVSMYLDHRLNFSKFINVSISHSFFAIFYFTLIHTIVLPFDFATLITIIAISHIIMFIATLTFDDITYISNLMSRYEREEYTDHLTQLGNVKALDRDVETWIKSKNHITMYLIDIDGFSVYNENFGFKTGDYIIKQMVEALQNCAPQGALLFRNSGEEFTMLIGELNFDKSVRLAEAIRKSIENTEFFIDNQQGISLTVSIGIGYHSKSLPTNKSSLFKDADNMLHAAKQQGQNKVMFNPL